MSNKIAIVAKITARPDAAEQVAGLLTGLVEAADGEPGTEVYALHREGEATFWVYELYTDAAALDAHSSSPALAEAAGAFGDLLAEPPTLSVASPIAAKGLPG